MNAAKRWAWIGTTAGCLALAAPPVVADEASELEALRAELKQLREEVAELRKSQQGPAAVSGEDRDRAMDEAYRAANRKAAELSGPWAGINEKGQFVFGSADGKFNAKLHALIQFRYIWNSLDTDNAGAGSNRASDSLSGIQIRRVRAGIEGDFGDGWGYKARIATQRADSNASRTFTDSNGDTVTVTDRTVSGGDVFLEEFYITYKHDKNWSMKAGVDQLPFARQELVNGRVQIAVDRALATEFFTLNRADFVQLNYSSDDYKAYLAVSDGGNNEYAAGVFNDGSNDFAITARAEWQAIGDDWSQNKDEFAGVAPEDALFFGAAMHYQVTEGAGGSNADSGLAWTADVLYKFGDVALSAAVFGQHTDNIAGFADTDQYGLYAQGDYAFTTDWRVFARYDWIDDDGFAGPGTEQLQAVTFGLNHDFNAFVRLTGDVVYIFAGDAPVADGNFINDGALSSSAGLTSAGFGAGDDHDDQVSLRLQLQLLF